MTRRRVGDGTWVMREGFAFDDVHYATQRSVKLDLESRGAVEQFALGLALLDEGLAASILLLGYKDARLAIHAAHANAFEACNARLEVALDENTLGHLKVFVLTAVRDGLAAVDHTDIDLYSGEPPATFTLRIPQTALPGPIV